MKRTLVLLAIAGCGGGTSDPDAPPGTPDAAGTPRETIGSVEVWEDHTIYDDGSGPVDLRAGQVSARFYDGHPPDFHRQVTTDGACRLRRYTPSNCDPACDSGLCVDTNVCEPLPTLVSAGDLAITGTATPVSITPVSGYYYPTDPLPEDLFADTAAIHAALAGADLAAMTLDATGVPPLVTPIQDKITLVPGADHTVAWTPAGGGRVRLTLNANNAGHGAPYMAIIECEADDAAGSITVPSALIDAFPETQAWHFCAGSDCPPSNLRRFHTDAAPIGADQQVELVVASQFTFGVDHILPD